MPRRERARRRSAADLTASLDRLAGKNCIAIVIESTEEPGVVDMTLMLCERGCARCSDARARMRKPKPYTPPNEPE
jgi:hypothetical protein